MSPRPSPRGPGDAPQTHTGAYLLFNVFIYLFYLFNSRGVTPHFLPPFPNKVFIKDSGSICFSLRCRSNAGFESQPCGLFIQKTLFAFEGLLCVRHSPSRHFAM